MQAMIDKVASECVAVRLRMLNRVITNIYDDALRSLDLKVSQMSILVAAAKMGTARPIEVCEHLHLDVSTLSRNVERMKPQKAFIDVADRITGSVLDVGCGTGDTALFLASRGN